MSTLITDEIMFSFGFVKMKHFEKKKNGVSSFNWCIGTENIFSIEKDLGSDDSEIFYPTIRIFNTVKFFFYVHEIQDFMRVFHEVELPLR